MTTADKIGLIAISAVGIGTALFFVLKRRNIKELTFRDSNLYKAMEQNPEAIARLVQNQTQTWNLDFLRSEGFKV